MWLRGGLPSYDPERIAVRWCPRSRASGISATSFPFLDALLVDEAGRFTIYQGPRSSTSGATMTVATFQAPPPRQITNDLGLHLRPAARFAQLGGAVRRRGPGARCPPRLADGKSPLGLIGLAADDSDAEVGGPRPRAEEAVTRGRPDLGPFTMRPRRARSHEGRPMDLPDGDERGPGARSVISRSNGPSWVGGALSSRLSPGRPGAVEYPSNIRNPEGGDDAESWNA